jgi:hypothetical protein
MSDVGKQYEDHKGRVEVVFEGETAALGLPFRLTVHFHPDDEPPEITYGCEVQLGRDSLGAPFWCAWGRADEFVDAPVQGDVCAAIIEALVEAKGLMPEWAAEIQRRLVTPPKGPPWVTDILNGNEA